MTLFCPVSKLEIKTSHKWSDKKVSRKFISNFFILGDSILYSLPKGRADLEGTQASLLINKEVAKNISQGDGPYVQIEDYTFLKGATLSARRFFTKKMDSDDRMVALIFCNLSPQMSLAVKIGRRFKVSKVNIHIAKHYKDAIKLGVEICNRENIKQKPLSHKICNHFIQNQKFLKPIDLIVKDEWDIDTPGFSNKSVVIDRQVLHSTSKGYLGPEHVPLIDSMRDDCQATIAKNSTIKYILIDCRDMKGANRAARFKYMQSLKSWHRQYPIKLYIAYNTNLFMRTALKLAGSLMPFKVRIAKDFAAALQLIRLEKSRPADKDYKTWSKKESVTLNTQDINKLLTVIGGFNWEHEDDGIKEMTEEQHPLFYVYQSIQLIKEEIDDLFQERKQKEEILKEGQDRYKSLFKNNHSIMLILNPESGKIMDANPAALKFYGWSYEEIIQKNISEFNTSPRQEIFQKNKTSQKKQRQPFFFEHRLANREIRNVEVYSGPITIDGKSLLYSIIHDITKRKQAEEQLKKSREQFRLFVDTSPDFYFLKDINRQYMMVNKSIANFFNKKESEIIGKTDFNLMLPEEAQHFLKSDLKTVKDKKMTISNETLGNNIFELRKIPVFTDKKVSGVAGIIRDITDKKKAELEREKLITKLQKALEEIKTLKGIVPICSSCKKIRDDSGYWNNLESYIQKHSEASFSHSMCPECSDKFYGTENWYIKMKKDKIKK